MIFSSYEFVFAFLPVVLLGALIAQRLGDTPIKVWLILASLVFYTAWYPPYVLVLLGSIFVNFAILRFALSHDPESRSRFWSVFVGVAANLCLLGWFKYSGFVAFNLDALFDARLPLPSILLPLGISFFTFQKIALLIDVYRRQVREISLLNYMLFVTFFPQLIAGPIVLFPEVQGQYREAGHVRVTTAHFALGLSIFAVGLFKKAAIADLMGSYATAIFSSAAAGGAFNTADAWVGALAYTLQIYFDFSGYSDMAIGLAAMFGVVLPFNFASPYRATSIIDFWRRWHMTLSRFLRDYLYIPLGGNRRGTTRRYINLMLVMLIGGLWHGAAWTFVAWGGLHGLFLVVNHAWRFALKKTGGSMPALAVVVSVLAWPATFLSVVIGWVFFRAESFVTATHLLLKMFDPAGLHEIARNGISLGAALGSVAFQQTNAVDPRYIPWVLAAGLAICLFLPNTRTLFGASLQALSLLPQGTARIRARAFIWAPSKAWAIALGAMCSIAVLAMARGSVPFLYFNF